MIRNVCISLLSSMAWRVTLNMKIKLNVCKVLFVGVMLTCKIYCSILYLFLNDVRLCLVILIYSLLFVLVTFSEGRAYSHIY